MSQQQTISLLSWKAILNLIEHPSISHTKAIIYETPEQYTSWGL